MHRAVSLLVLAVLSGCASTDTDTPLARDDAVAREVPQMLRTPQADRRRLLALVGGADAHVVVIPAERDVENTVVAQLEAWQNAGTGHVLPLELGRLERAAALLALADLIEISDSGTHAALRDARVIEALRAAMDRGVPVMASGSSEAELRECLGSK